MAGVDTLAAPESTDSSLVSRLGRSPNAFAVGFLVVVPILVFAVPAATGHPAISFDNMLQNYPLRVLSGSDLAHGHLPLWNPTIWSGSPLLGGLNAGSFYPGTLLFAVLPGVLAWVLNLLVVYWAAGLGMYALLRHFSVRPLGALLAAVTYQFGGAMTGQLVHLGIIQGMGWMPLAVLGEIRLAEALLGTRPVSLERPLAPRRSSPWPWVALLAAIYGLIFLTGEPRAMAEAELVMPFVLVWLALRSYPGFAVDLGRRVQLVAYGVLAAAWGAVIGAAQLLPGRTFILASQRAHEDYAYFGLGSLRASWTILMLVPNYLGGNAVFGQPPFAIGYNLPEVTGYMGLLAVAAFFTLALRSFGRRSDPRARDWRPWVVLAVLGLLLSWGTFTPLGHVFVLIPFYNKVRLDSRSLGIVDLALAIVFGFFLELVLAGEWRERMKGRAQFWRERVVPALGPAAGFVAAIVMLAFPATVLVAYGANPVNSSDKRPWMAAQAAVALGALGVLWAWRHWRPVGARRLLTVVVAADLGLFALSSSTGMFAGGAVSPSRASAAAQVGTTGRFAIVGVPNTVLTSYLSEPDINGLTGLDSVQGYGSIVSLGYDDRTGTHFQDTMDPCALARGVFVALRLHTLFLGSSELVQRVVPNAPNPPPPQCSGRLPAEGTASLRNLYFGRDLSVSSVRIVLERPTGHPLVVGVVSSSGATSFPAERVTGAGRDRLVTFATPERVAGIAVRGDARSVSDASSVTTTAGVRYVLDGPFQQAVGQSRWHLTELWHRYGRFRTNDMAPPVQVVGAPGATTHRVSSTQWGTETDVVDTPRPATVIRSEAYLAGWRVRATPLAGGPTRTLAVSPHGLVQSVRVPAGRWRLVFSYWPSGLELGGVASALAVLAFGVFGLVAISRRRRRAASVDAGPAR